MTKKKQIKKNYILLKKVWGLLVLSIAILFFISILNQDFAYSNTQTQIDSQYDFEETLSRMGSRGDEVRRIQRKLKELGYYNGSVDGIFGIITENAVKSFQRNVGIRVDGIAGAQTLLYLGLNRSQETLSRIGSRGDEVRRIQRKLKELGYYNGSVDGIFGIMTENAVKSFQRNVGIGVDGIVGPQTLLYLGLGGGGGTSNANAGGYSSNDAYLLARIIGAEARGEPYTGQVAVGAVVLNRIRHPSFPDSVAGVVYQTGAFDAVRDRNWNVAPDANAKRAAQDAINGWDPTGGAIYYYNPNTATNQWIRTRPVSVTIGRHIFCR